MTPANCTGPGNPPITSLLHRPPINRLGITREATRAGPGRAGTNSLRGPARCVFSPCPRTAPKGGQLRVGALLGKQTTRAGRPVDRGKGAGVEAQTARRCCWKAVVCASRDEGDDTGTVFLRRFLLRRLRRFFFVFFVFVFFCKPPSNGR